jgi:hypothetical protein
VRRLKGYFYMPDEKGETPDCSGSLLRGDHRRRSHSPPSLPSTAKPSPRTPTFLRSADPNTFRRSELDRLKPAQPRLRLPHPPHLPIVECGPGCACPCPSRAGGQMGVELLLPVIEGVTTATEALPPVPLSTPLSIRVAEINLETACANRPTQGESYPCAPSRHSTIRLTGSQC